MPRKRELTDYDAGLRARIGDAVERGDSLRSIAAAEGISAALVHKIAGMMRAVGALPPEPERVQKRRENSQAAREAALASREGRRDLGRAELSDTLLHRLSAVAVERLLQRLGEELEGDARVGEARRALDEAVLALEALNAADDGDAGDAELVKVKKELRASARQRVTDARLVLGAYREGRIPVRELVGVLTRAVGDHLALEGQAQAVPPPIILEFGAPLPLAIAPRIFDEAELAGTVSPPVGR